MDTAQWPQGIGVVRAVENTIRPTAEKKPRPLKEQALNCPRCNSTNTKFCYYNNYSLSQLRYFCKTCRRYWTEGGTLRSVPVGGGSRKNKRPSSSSSSSSIHSSSKKLIPNLTPPKFSQQNPKIQDGKDLNLGYNPTIFNGMSQFASLPFGLDPKIFNNPQENPNYNLSSSIMSSSLTNSMPGSNYSASFMNPLNQHDQLFKPSLNFSLDGLDNQNNGGYGNNINSGVNQEHADSSSRTLNFPFEELKPVAGSDGHFQMQDRGQASAGDSSNNGYWINGMLAAGGMLGENNYI